MCIRDRYLVQEKCRDDEKKWREFLIKVKEKLGNEEIKDFLLVLRDCCLAKGSEFKVPSFVLDEIGKVAGLDLDTLQKELERQRLKRFVRNLFAPGATVSDRLDDLKKIKDSGLAAKFVAPDIVKCLKDENSKVRSAAVQALGNLGNASEPVVEAILALLEDDDLQVRRSAVQVLGNLGNASETVVQALLGLLQDNNNDLVMRYFAVEALGNLGRNSEVLEQALLGLLENSNNDLVMRHAAVEALGNLGNASEAVMQFLLNVVKDSDSIVCSSALKALDKLRNRAV